MSLEENLAANTAALEAMTAAMNRNSDLLDILTAKAKSAQGAETTKAPKVDAEAPKIVKPAEEPAEKKTRGRPTKAEKAPTVEEMVAATKKFLSVEAEDEYNARRDFVKETVEKYGVKKMSEIEESKRRAALDALDNFTRGEPDDDQDEDDLA